MRAGSGMVSCAAQSDAGGGCSGAGASETYALARVFACFLAPLLLPVRLFVSYLHVVHALLDDDGRRQFVLDGHGLDDEVVDAQTRLHVGAQDGRRLNVQAHEAAWSEHRRRGRESNDAKE